MLRGKYVAGGRYRPTAGLWAFIVVVVCACSQALALDALPKPQGPVILTVSGNIEVTNSERGAEFDREMLEAFGFTEVRTTTSWTDGVQVFEGVLARAVLDRVGAKGSTVTATALNDFVAPVPMDHFRQYDVILATIMNGKQMEVSDWGPIWIVYPRDDYPELLGSKFNDHWVWQLRELRVE
ncbi:molybdopterin-dependent oxidoreductase [Devosia nitrariae]|uniref:molybdopterin-dependent oxidoreductase n=1 Tax=Devosia nitrariae TaxID=2071872 RepID=UPI0024E08EB9|nr:molybdopterin-dependent oxidoreductase [Devosia nitrariae]